MKLKLPLNLLLLLKVMLLLLGLRRIESIHDRSSLRISATFERVDETRLAREII